MSSYSEIPRKLSIDGGGFTGIKNGALLLSSCNRPKINDYSSILSEESSTSSSKKSFDLNSKAKGINILLLSNKSRSLPRNSNIYGDYGDKTLPEDLNAMHFSAESLAKEITFVDAQIFKRIQIDELQSCGGWTKKDIKETLCPNIVAFTRRFNNITFWVIQEILNGVTPKQRADLICHFLRVAKKLYELNNLHSLFAIVAAMKSASVFRMNETWNAVSKRDKQTLHRMATLFSEDNNWALLRQHLENVKLPCIPYLGLYLTDLIFIDVACPKNKAHPRETKINNILRVISSYQASLSEYR